MNGNGQLDHDCSYLAFCHPLRLRVSARDQSFIPIFVFGNDSAA